MFLLLKSCQHCLHYPTLPAIVLGQWASLWLLVSSSFAFAFASAAAFASALHGLLFAFISGCLAAIHLKPATIFARSHSWPQARTTAAAIFLSASVSVSVAISVSVSVVASTSAAPQQIAKTFSCDLLTFLCGASSSCRLFVAFWLQPCPSSHYLARTAPLWCLPT